MAIKFEKIQPGMTLYDVRKNTGYGGHKWRTWPVYVVSVDPGARTVVARWNGNKQEVMSERRITSYRAKQPTNKV